MPFLNAYTAEPPRYQHELVHIFGNDHLGQMVYNYYFQHHAMWFAEGLYDAGVCHEIALVVLHLRAAGQRAEARLMTGYGWRVAGNRLSANFGTCLALRTPEFEAEHGGNRSLYTPRGHEHQAFHHALCAWVRLVEMRRSFGRPASMTYRLSSLISQVFGEDRLGNGFFDEWAVGDWLDYYQQWWESGTLFLN